MRKNKRIIFLCIILLCVIVFGAVLWFSFEKTEWLPTDFTEKDEDEVVVCEGKKYEYNEHLSNYLFLGIDKREVAFDKKNTGNVGQADAILLVSYDRVKNTVKCLSIPRDTMAMIRTISWDGIDLGKSEDHINIQYAFGDGKDKSCRLMKEAVQTLLYDVPIQGYCAVSMNGIATAVETVGTVELVVPDDSLADVNSDFQKGNTVIITKENAEQFVRYRDTDVRQSAMVRGSRQKVFVKAFANRAKQQAMEDERLVTTMYEKLRPYMVTNMGNDVFVKLLEATNDTEGMIVDLPGETVNGADFDEYHVDDKALYKLVLDMFYEEVRDDL